MQSSLNLFTKVIGTGKPVLFLHGFLEDHSIWHSIYPDFVNSGFQCVLVDLPCHGETRYYGENCSMTEMAKAVDAVLFRLNVENPIVIGHSMGGYVALELLRLRPLQPILLHSNFWEDPETKKADRNRVIEIVKLNKSLFLNEAVPNLFAPVNREFRREQIQNLIAQANKIPSSEIMAATAGMRDRKSSYDLLNTHNIILIQGSDDPIIPSGILEAQLLKLNFRPEIITISDCGHMSFIEQPNQLINALKSLLIK